MLIVLVLTSKGAGGIDANSSPSPSAVLKIDDAVQTLPPVQKIPLEEPEARQDGSLILDPDLEIAPSSSPSVLKDKNVQFTLPKTLP
jgi:hypothetical protein